ncbi:MAG: 30S ribosomal protein S16 [Candidatus Yanofskybacteria bacterium RIFCSPLOWO2_02_FULL_45_18]|uniref:Small ribosomal subunit protein bS16 n=3 Tax=Candidatus Yanofskyibacteriota TaxID=1752733 RepID=A0A1F8H322_9BACT|nr:MAG: 30S ribosomal protein S16 [Candidatus Yanofskybacteria bacterium RIFCSPLOWO2_02_FULL_45_18]
MLIIRLQRVGKRGQAYFRVVVLEHTKKTKGEFLELLGSYDPHKKALQAQKERIEYWISKGAQISPTVNNLLVNYKYWDKSKMASWKPKSKSKTKEAGGIKPAPAKKLTSESGEILNAEARSETPATESQSEAPSAEAVTANI